MPTSKKSTTLGDITKKIKLSNVKNIKLNQILYTVLLIAVFLIGYLFARVQMLEGQGSTALPSQQQLAGNAGQEIVADVAIGKLPIRGDKGAKVEIVEFSDFECPFCEQFFTQTLPQIEKEYVDTGKVKLYFRHFPLDFHPAALPTALAAECADSQGKFWEFHDKVFANQAQIAGGGEKATAALKQFAQDLGLNTSQFNQCLDNAEQQADVDKDINDGKTAGVSGTPTFYINGRQLVGAQPFAAFKAIIDEELKK